MTDIRVTVSDFAEVSERMSKLGAEWQSIAFDCLGETLQMEKVMGEIRKRTPRSELTSPWNLTTDKNGKVRRKISAENPRKNGYVPGMNTLRNDLRFYVGGNSPASRSFEIGMKNVEYAGAVHEMTESSRGRSIDWTTQGTGAKFIEKPVEDARDWIPQNISSLIEEKLVQKGII